MDINYRDMSRVAVMAMLATMVSGGIAAQEAPDLQQQIERQKAENEALRAKIAKFEQVLKTDVCTNPEAGKLLEEDKNEPRPDATKTPEPPPAR